MMSPTDSTTGPAESQRGRTLLYLAEGMVTGALSFFAAVFIFRAF